MSTITNAVFAALLGAGIISLIIILRFFMSVPVTKPENSRIFTVITTRGDAPELENAVKGLVWLIRTAHLDCGIIIADSGLLPEGRKRAELMARDNPNVILCSSDSLEDIFAERKP